MTKFNAPTNKRTTKTINYEGEEAYSLDNRLALYSAVVTTSLSDKFYESAGDRISRISELVKVNDPLFVAKLAVYAREKMYLRSVPLVLLVELAKAHSGDNLLSRAVARTVQRADEITELLAYYSQSNGREDIKKLGKLSKQIQKGLADAFNKFDEYQFAKYNRDGAVKLKDALFLVHPRPKDEEQQGIFNRIVSDELKVPYTWEVELSVLGTQSFASEKEKNDAFKAKWEELIESGQMGYMALMRNLRNFLNYGVSAEHIATVCNVLSDKERVLRAKQLPFRFLSAYRSLKGNSNPNVAMIVDALEDAILASVDNLAGFDYNTSLLIASDVSGSMNVPVSPKSTIENYDIGIVLGMLLRSKCKSVITGVFGTDWKAVNLPSNTVLHNSDHMEKLSRLVGWATNGWKVIEYINAKGVKLDKVMLFSDMQLWDTRNYGYYGQSSRGNSFKSEWKNYRKNINPDAKLYLFDLSGYGNTPLSTNDENVYFISGWSEKVFDVLEALEAGKSAVSEIENIDI